MDEGYPFEEILSTPHGELETRRGRRSMRGRGLGLSTPHGELETFYAGFGG